MNPPVYTPTDQAPADPGATDDMPATRPVGYRSGLVHAAVTRHLRDAMARIDVAQPQYWVLNRVNGGAAGARAVVREGTDDEEYVAALEVLRGMPADVERDGDS
ncbi:hypothetical protein [Streptomyces sp. HB2AG]|uniref:hypothetical protein n=1 Tax=Streptomyces sp. HB2AG TaxID=2983400 RepID=UPI0022AAAF1E|nr:hypothetical protein [Streptomyces sp. HB2AG]MCZ2527036.1 hypothetical protein [Streptomyces sp. HB2AG]